MPRGGHKGLLYPVSGLLMNQFGKKRKRGLYHHHTSEIFRPRWGPIRQDFIAKNLNILKWNNGTISASEMLPSENVYHKDAHLAWLKPRPMYTSKMYQKNEERYFKPARMANTEEIRKYLYNVLDPVNLRKNGFVGPELDSKHTISSHHISKIVNSENDSSLPKINLEVPQSHRRWDLKTINEIFRFKKLEHLIRESDAWRFVSQDHKSSTNPFPHVNEGASLIRTLQLSDILYTRGNHRLNRRAHPKWYTAKYVKFLKKRQLNEKLHQLQLESYVE